MNSHTQIQNTLNHPPLQPYSPNLNPSTPNSPTQQVEVGTRTKRDRPNKQPRKSKTPAAKRLANTKQLNYQQWLEVQRTLAAVMLQPHADSILYVDAGTVDD